MATANDLNISQSGYVVFDGTATFTGRTFQEGAGINLINASGVSGNTTISAIMQSRTITLTSQQVKALNNTAITVVPAQGLGSVIVPISFTVKLTYGGTNAFSNGTVQFRYNNTSGKIALQLTLNNLLTSTQNYYSYSFTTVPVDLLGTAAENVPIIIWNSAANITGNAANDNTLEVNCLYYVVTI